jgi:hypothetical protein
MLDYLPGRPSNFLIFLVSPRNEFSVEVTARISKSSLSKGGYGNSSVLSQLHVALCKPLHTPIPPPLILAFLCHIFSSPGCDRKKIINTTMIAPANVAPPPIPAYNLPDLKHVEDNQTIVEAVQAHIPVPK